MSPRRWRFGVTVIHFVPSMLNAFLQDHAAADCTSLRTVIVSGEALPETVARRFFETLSAQLENLYGPTEAAIDVTRFTVSPQTDHVMIGQPIANTRIYVLDAELEPAPIGAVGEIFLAGRGVARGYAGLAGLTAERFVADPFVEGQRMYRTGDRGRWSAEGQLEFLGRLDGQVKLRGHRIELGEVEAAIQSGPAVTDAAVCVHGQDANRILVGYVVAAMGFDKGRLLAHLRASLPEYMTPNVIVVLDRLPLNANGKVDRKALRLPKVREELDGTFAPAQTVLQQKMATIWAELLGLDRIGLDDNFFALGGHSLLAVRLTETMSERLDLGIPLRLLFEHPTIRELDAFLKR